MSIFNFTHTMAMGAYLIIVRNVVAIMDMIGPKAKQPYPEA
jgi:hypothetical protein